VASLFPGSEQVTRLDDGNRHGVAVWELLNLFRRGECWRNPPPCKPDVRRRAAALRMCVGISAVMILAELAGSSRRT
jgi:hypothetical protein